MSFGFKYGIFLDVDLVFDVCFLLNLYYKLELRDKIGLDIEVYDYVMSFDELDDFYDYFFVLIKLILLGY